MNRHQRRAAERAARRAARRDRALSRCSTPVLQDLLGFASTHKRLIPSDLVFQRELDDVCRRIPSFRGTWDVWVVSEARFWVCLDCGTLATDPDWGCATLGA